MLVPYQMRVTRPKVDDARKAFKDGIAEIFKRSDVIEDVERQALLEQRSAALEAVVKENFPSTDNLEYAILKCHLLIEFIIDAYIESMSYHRIEIGKLRFQFAQKLEVAAMMGFGAYSKRILPTIDLLNQSRNQVAHRFTLDREIIDEVFRWWAEEPEIVDRASDGERIDFLKWFCSLMAGETSGTLWAHALKSNSFQAVVEASAGETAENTRENT